MSAKRKGGGDPAATAPAAGAPGASAPAGAAAPPSPFTLPLYRDVWVSNLVSSVGSLIQTVGASWMMTSLGASATVIALVQTANLLPTMLLSVWAGAAADNLDRRRLMLAAQTFMLVVSALLAVAAWRGWVTPVTLLGATFLLACGSAVNGPAWQASVGDMVPKPVLPAAVAYNGVSFNIARSVGPALGGLVVAAAGAGAAFLLNAVSYLGIIVVLARWKAPHADTTLPRERLGAAILTGVRYVGLSPRALAVFVRAAAFGVAASALPALMPLVAKATGGGAVIYGVLLGAFGVGAVIGAVASVRLRRVLSSETLIRGAAVALAAGALVIAARAPLPVVVAALVVAGVGWVAALSTFNIIVQLASPRWVVARVIGLYQTANFGGMTVGSWGFGALAQAHGVSTSLATAAALQLAGLVLGLALPLPASGGENLDPVAPWTPPEGQPAPDPRSGPVVVTLQSHVAAEKLPAFLHLMQARRRARLQEGARRWSLLQDLADPTLWVERFQFATWLDYLRFHTRMTQSGKVVADAVDALRTPGSTATLTRWIEQSPARAATQATAPDAGAQAHHPPMT